MNKKTNTTRTSTSYYELPAGFTPPPTNQDGTHTSVVPIETELGKTTNFEVAYPTEILMSRQYYFWSGILPTIDAMGQSICSTADERETITANTPVNPTPTAAASTDVEDPYGFVYSLNAQVWLHLRENWGMSY